MIFCALILSNTSLIEEATKCLFRTSLRSTHSIKMCFTVSNLVSTDKYHIQVRKECVRRVWPIRSLFSNTESRRDMQAWKFGGVWRSLCNRKFIWHELFCAACDVPAQLKLVWDGTLNVWSIAFLAPFRVPLGVHAAGGSRHSSVHTLIVLS